MDKNKIVTGYCPTLGEDYSICVRYRVVRAMAIRGYVKDSFRCEYNVDNGSCPVTDCPVFMCAPDALQ